MRCGRILKSEPWAGMGIGSTCAAKLGITPPRAPRVSVSKGQEEKSKRQKGGISMGRGVFDLSLQRGIDGMPIVNVPHAIVRHSPDGFEWGYSGSGPAELALNILSVMVGTEKAQKDGLYQQFKRDFISGMSYEGGEIKASDIEKWLRERGLL